jgi:hypothetical protein
VYPFNALDQVGVVVRPTFGMPPNLVAGSAKRFEVVDVGNIDMECIVTHRQYVVRVVAPDRAWLAPTYRTIRLGVCLRTLGPTHV